MAVDKQELREYFSKKEKSNNKGIGVAIINSTLKINLSFEMPTNIQDTAQAEKVIPALLTDFAKDYLKSSDVELIESDNH